MVFKHFDENVYNSIKYIQLYIIIYTYTLLSFRILIYHHITILAFNLITKRYKVFQFK